MLPVTPKAVIFDIGNVLIEWNPERMYDRVIGREAREHLFATVDLHAMNDRIDRGEPWKEVVQETAAAHPEFAPAIGLWHERWHEMASPVIEGSLELLRALRASGVPVHCLTNFGRETFAHAEQIYPFLFEFDRRYVTGQLGISKPEPALYAHVEADCGYAGPELFFTDDRDENLAAADVRGWQTYRFDNPRGLADRLRGLGFAL